MIKLRLTLLVLAVATFALPSTALADWPERPVHFIVPYPAGGASDVATRLVTNYVSGTLPPADRGRKQFGRQRQHRHRVRGEKTPTATRCWSRPKT
jgi:hypothetical protein